MAITENIPHTIRFPEPLYKKIKQLADGDHRSFNAEILWLIEQGILRQSSLQESKEGLPK